MRPGRAGAGGDAGVPEYRAYALAAAGYLALALICNFRMLTDLALPLSSDAWSQNYPLRAFYSEWLHKGVLPLWNPYEFLGIPFAGAVQTGAFYPPNVILFGALPAWAAFCAQILMHAVIAGLGTYALARGEGAGRVASFAGGAVFALGGYLALEREHTAIVNAAAWMPLAALALVRLARRPNIRGTALLAIALGMQLLAGNFQMCLYTYVALAVLGLRPLLAGRPELRARFVMAAIAGGVGGIAIGLPQVVAALATGEASLRPVLGDSLGQVFFGSFPLYMGTLPSLAAPLPYLDGASRALLGVPSDAVLAFVGTVPLAGGLALAWREFRTSGTVRAWTAVAVAGLLIAILPGTPLGSFFSRIPVMGMFRAHGRAVVILTLAASVLGALWMDRAARDRKMALAGAAALGGLLCAGLLAIAIEAREAAPVLLSGGVALALGCGGGAALLAWGLRGRTLTVALAIVVAAELFAVFWLPARGWVSLRTLDGVCERMGFEAAAKGGDGVAPPRVLNAGTTTGTLWNIPCGVGVVDAYDQVMPRDLASLIDIDPLGYGRYADRLLGNPGLLAMIGVTRVIAPETEAQRIAETRAFPEQAASSASFHDGTVRVLSPPEAPEHNIVRLARYMPPGDYVVSIKARSVGAERASLRMEVFGDETRTLRFDYTPLYSYPGVVGPGTRTYARVFRNPRGGQMGLAFISHNREAVEISEIEIGELRGAGAGAYPYALSAQGKGYAVFENLYPMGRAYAVERVGTVEGLDTAHLLLDTGEIDPRREAFVLPGEGEELRGRAFTPGTLAVREYGLHRVVIDADFPAEGFAVLAEQYDPDWVAAIDGAPARVYRVGGAMRGVVVPPGRHEVVFTYRPRTLYAALWAAALAAALAVAALIWRRRAAAADAG
jgi:hypothetical protein